MDSPFSNSPDHRLRSEVERLEPRFLFAGDLNLQVDFGEFQPSIENAPTAVAGLLETGLSFDVTRQVDQQYLLAWSSANFNGDWKAVARTHRPDASPDGAIFVIGDFPAGTEQPQVRAVDLNDNTYLVVWSNDRHAQAAHVDRFGNAEEPHSLLSNASIHELSVAPMSPNGYMLCWIDRSGASEEVRGQFFDDNHLSVGSEFVVFQAPVDAVLSDLNIAHQDANLIAVDWSETDAGLNNVVHHRHSVDIQGNTLQTSSQLISTGSVTVRDVASNSRGHFAAVRQSVLDSIVQTHVDLFDEAGELLQTRLMASEPIDTLQADSSIQSIDDGFVASYARVLEDGRVGIFAQQLNHSAEPVGPEFSISNGAAFDATRLTTSQLSERTFAVSWIGFDLSQNFPVLFTNTLRLGSTPVALQIDGTEVLQGDEIISISGLPTDSGLTKGSVDEATGNWNLRVDEIADLHLIGDEVQFPLSLHLNLSNEVDNLGDQGLLFGSDANDQLVGTLAEDHFQGGAGIDTFVVPGNADEYQITKIDDQAFTIVNLDHPGNVDVLQDVEFVQFDDRLQEVRTTPAVRTQDVVGLEDNEVAIPLVIAPFELHPSEMRTVTISGVPVGYTITDGETVIDSQGVEDQIQLNEFSFEQLRLIPLEHDDSDLEIQVVVSVSSAELSSLTATDTFIVQIKPVVDGAQLTVAASTGTSDQPIPIVIESKLVDQDGSESLESVFISGLPETAVLNAGTKLPDGDWKLNPNDVAGLEIVAGSVDAEQLSLVVSTVVTELSNGESNVTSQNLAITVEQPVDVDPPDEPPAEPIVEPSEPPEPPEPPVPPPAPAPPPVPPTPTPTPPAPPEPTPPVDPQPEPPADPTPIPDPEPPADEPTGSALPDDVVSAAASTVVVDEVFSTDFSALTTPARSVPTPSSSSPASNSESPVASEVPTSSTTNETSETESSQSDSSDDQSTLHLGSDDLGLSLSGMNEHDFGGHESFGAFSTGSSSGAKKKRATAEHAQTMATSLQASRSVQPFSDRQRDRRRLERKESTMPVTEQYADIGGFESQQPTQEESKFETIFIGHDSGIAANFDANQIWSETDSVEQTLMEDIEIEELAVGTAVVVATGYSIAHITWLLRSGVVATKLISSVPIWGSIDFLHMLPENDDENSESLADIVTAT